MPARVSRCARPRAPERDTRRARRHAHGRRGGRSGVRARAAAVPVPPGVRRRRPSGRQPRRRLQADDSDQGGGRRRITRRAVREGPVMSGIDPGRLREAIASPRWTALSRAGLDLASLERWDATLLRESRVLVPIDLQALYVPEGSAEAMVRLPFALTEPDGQPPAEMPAPFDAGAAREPGVHLHWAMPDALLRGTLTTKPDGSRNRLELAALPDRWLVLRLYVPSGAAQVATRGWVVCADTGTVVGLADWAGEQSPPAAKRRTVAPNELTGSVGGSPQWASTYDAVIDRFAFHDPLDDLAAAAPNGVAGDQLGYLVTGWWSHAELDPLDSARTNASLHDHL